MWELHNLRGLSERRRMLAENRALLTQCLGATAQLGSASASVYALCQLRRFTRLWWPVRCVGGNHSLGLFRNTGQLLFHVSLTLDGCSVLYCYCTFFCKKATFRLKLIFLFPWFSPFISTSLFQHLCQFLVFQSRWVKDGLTLLEFLRRRAALGGKGGEGISCASAWQTVIVMSEMPGGDVRDRESISPYFTWLVPSCVTTPSAKLRIEPTLWSMWSMWSVWLPVLTTGERATKKWYTDMICFLSRSSLHFSVKVKRVQISPPNSLCQFSSLPFSALPAAKRDKKRHL